MTPVNRVDLLRNRRWPMCLNALRECSALSSIYDVTGGWYLRNDCRQLRRADSGPWHIIGIPEYASLIWLIALDKFMLASTRLT